MDIMGHFLFKRALNLQTETTDRKLSYSSAKFFINIGLQLPFLDSLRIWFFQSLICRQLYPRTMQNIILNYLSQGGQHVKQELRFMSANLTIPEDDIEWVRDVQTEAIWHFLAGSCPFFTSCISFTISVTF